MVRDAAIFRCDAGSLRSLLWWFYVSLIIYLSSCHLFHSQYSQLQYSLLFSALRTLLPEHQPPKMSIRTPIARLARSANPSQVARLTARDAAPSWQQSKGMATVVPPVTQDHTSRRGPTAMVFMNMGGPATTDEVGDFLSRLFVRSASYLVPRFKPTAIRLLTNPCRPTAT